MKKITVASRESRLAVIQSEIITDAIKRYNPNITTELITMKTTGDRILDRTLDEIGGKGLFVKELDRALYEGRADITIHSLKDMPAVIDSRIPIVAYSERKHPFDALVLPKGTDKIDYGKPFGCSSKRRALQIKELYPEAKIASIRGNVPTRLEKLDGGEYAALILAEAGLVRLGLEDRIFRRFTADEIIPSAGQGIIAVQGRAGEDYSYLDKVNCRESQICAAAERAFTRALDGGCSVPVAAYARINGSSVFIRGMNVRDNKIIKDSVSGDISRAEELGLELAERMRG